MHPLPYAWTYAVSFNCSQWQTHRYGLPELPSVSLCIRHQILSILHLPCPVVQWAPVVLNYKHLSMAFLISPVDHVVSIVRSWTYFTCLVTQSAPVVLKNKHFRMAFLSCPVHHGIWIVRSIEYRLHLAWPSNAARCAALFPTCKHSVKTRVLRQWAVLLLLEWVAICLKIEGIWTYNIHWHFIYI